MLVKDLDIKISTMMLNVQLFLTMFCVFYINLEHVFTLLYLCVSKSPR